MKRSCILKTGRLVGIFVLFTSYNVYSSSCYIDHSRRVKLSEEYAKQVEFAPTIDDSEMDVVVRFPKEIEGANLTTMTLVRTVPGSDDAVFIFPLYPESNGDSVSSWFMLTEDMSHNNVIVAAYGRSCSLVLQYNLDYKRAELVPSLEKYDE